MTIDDEAATDDERAESGCDDRTRPRDAELRSSFEPRDLAVGDDVPEVGRQLHAEGHREPDRVEVV